MAILKKYEEGASTGAGGDILYNPDKLKNYLSDMNKKFKDDDGNLLWETDSTAIEGITDMWTKANLRGVTLKEGFNVDEPWSGVAISGMVMGLTGKPASELKNFQVSSGHNKYITDSFRYSKDKDYQYNLYKPVRLDAGEERDGKHFYNKFDVGDILFRGRGKHKHMSYDDMENAAINGKGYDSHTDMITGKGQDSKGYYYEITGGNRGTSTKELDRFGLEYDYDDNTDTPHPTSMGGVFSTTKVYYDPETGKLKGTSYKGGMKFNDDFKADRNRTEDQRDLTNARIQRGESKGEMVRRDTKEAETERRKIIRDREQ